jgi:hypothetical protein
VHSLTAASGPGLPSPGPAAGREVVRLLNCCSHSGVHARLLHNGEIPERWRASWLLWGPVRGQRFLPGPGLLLLTHPPEQPLAVLNQAGAIGPCPARLSPALR